MPTYQYKCLKCDYRFEEFQLMTEQSLSQCPQCSGAVERLISGGAGFLFKGSGFYITDYRSEKYKKDAANDKPKPAASTSSKKSESKPKKTAKAVKNTDS